MVFECKCCGGSLKIEENASIGVCEYCGNTMTIPKVDDEKIMHLFNRANHLRMKSEFDNAMIVYENIVAEDKKNAEAYWGICLCKYGIEYVTDPNTEKMIPTCHRSSFTSILQDEDYASALEYADSVVQSIYKEEASQIALIQKKLLEVSANEEPYDIFISYKESDNNGTRTKDSVYAQDIYYELTKKDYRVFFSRISLEKVIGKEYEPYIFSALNSAKIMIIVGTSEQNMKAPWVKNEWSRFLSLMQEGAEKTLIPVYRDMDPYDMPEEFLNLQALDMGRLGFMQDLLEGVSKLLSSTKNEKETKPVIIDESSMEARKSVTPLIQRAFIFLEDDDWDKVDEYVERILDIDPYCGQAYLIKLLRTLQLSKVEELANLKERFDAADEYKKIMKYGDSELVELVKGYNQAIERKAQITKLLSIYLKRKEEENINERDYTAALKLMDSASTVNQFTVASEKFKQLSNYKDSFERYQKCLLKMNECEKENAKEKEYQRAVRYKSHDTISYLQLARDILMGLDNWKDTDTLVSEIDIRLEELETEKQQQLAEEKKKRRLKRIILSIVVIGIICIGLILISKRIKYLHSDEYLQQEVEKCFANDGGYYDALNICEKMENDNLKEEVYNQI